MSEERSRMGSTPARALDHRRAIALLLAVLVVLLCSGGALADGPFSIHAVDGQVVDQGGNAYTQAGGHPYAVSTQIELNHHQDTDPNDVFGLFFGGGEVPDGGNPK